MKNVLKAEFHKLFRGLNYCIFLTFIFTAAFIMVFSQSSSNGSKSFFIIVIDTTSILILTIAISGIFLVYIWSKERKNGYIKNIAGNVNGRYMLTIAKFIAGSAVIVINSFFTLFSVFINNLVKCLIKGGKISFTGAFEKESLMRYAEFLIWIVAGIAIMAMLLMLHEISENAALGYIMALQILVGQGLLEALLAQGTALLFKFDRLAEYLIICGTRMMQAAPVSSYINSDVVSEMYPNSMPGVFIRLCAYIAVFMVISVFVSKKKDV